MATDEWRETTFSSGVKVVYGPFPPEMFYQIQDRALRDHPDPDPPKREIETFDGPEWVDDEDDPDYKAALLQVRFARFNLLGEACLEWCVEIMDWPKWKPTLERIASKYASDPLPEDEKEQQVWFLAKWAIRTKTDWQIVNKIQRFTLIDDEEVERRIDFFRGDVAGAEVDGVDAPGPVEEVGLAVQPEA